MTRNFGVKHPHIDVARGVVSLSAEQAAAEKRAADTPDEPDGWDVYVVPPDKKWPWPWRVTFAVGCSVTMWALMIGAVLYATGVWE